MPSCQSDFPAFRPQLSPMRAARQRLAKARDLHHLESLASGWLPIERLRELASLPLKRLRWLPLPLVFWACLNMVFHPGSSCRESQRSIQSWWKARQRTWRDPCSSAFCAARARLPLDWLRRLWWRAADRLAASAPALVGCHGRRVLGSPVHRPPLVPSAASVVDATSVTAPDTHDNQQEWPQTKSQKPGCGFPLINLAGLFCLGSGALLRAAHGKWGTSEARLFCPPARHTAPGRHPRRRPGLLELCQPRAPAHARGRFPRAGALCRAHRLAQRQASGQRRPPHHHAPSCGQKRQPRHERPPLAAAARSHHRAPDARPQHPARLSPPRTPADHHPARPRALARGNPPRPLSRRRGTGASNFTSTTSRPPRRWRTGQVEAGSWASPSKPPACAV